MLEEELSDAKFRDIGPVVEDYNNWRHLMEATFKLIASLP